MYMKYKYITNNYSFVNNYYSNYCNIHLITNIYIKYTLYTND